MKVWISNWLWKISLRSSFTKFKKATKDSHHVQFTKLTRTLYVNESTSYGTKHNFPSLSTYEDFLRLPITTYEDYQSYIDTIMNDTTDNVLTASPPILLEPTSGSSGGSKYIPYTQDLKNEFSQGIGPWIYNLYQSKSISMSGTHYWSISPVLDTHKRTKTDLRVGFEEDSEYLGALDKMITETLFTVPKEVRFIKDVNTFRYVTLLFLLKDKHLSFISIWSPTFLLHLLDVLDKEYASLIHDLRVGSISYDRRLSDEQKALFETVLGKNIKRAQHLQHLSSSDITSIWPKLRTVSCWGDADSAVPKQQLASRIHPINIQEKGLIATECFVTFPLEGVGNVLSIQSHFFEFIKLEDYESGVHNTYVSDELEIGTDYIFLVTTGGGLYRYKIGDIVRVTGYYNSAPLLTFVGRLHTSDHYGEKLHSHHVNHIVDTVFKKHNLMPDFTLITIVDSNAPHYRIYVEGITLDTDILEEIDELLEENYHYKNCKHLGQLGNLDTLRIEDGYQKYVDFMISKGVKLGDIKPQLLLTQKGFQEFI